MSVKMKFGSKDIPFVYKGDKLIYPNPIKDGLLLWYDFKGMRNTDTNKEVAKDLSGNGNDGTLTNFNFTEGSGYKDNTLVFDGVDDKLTIPELELDETAMSVMHDGKLYAYEDDKVLTIGEDGEIVGSGKNLLLSGDTPQSSSEYILANYTYSEKLELDEPFTATIKVKLGEGAQHPRFYNTGGHVSGSFGAPSKIQEFPDGTTIWKLTATWKIAHAGNDFLRVYQVVSGGTYPVSTVEWCKLERGTTETPYVSASSDYTQTNLSPASITDLKLYNNTLHKNELLHNAESKGLKKLKPGVIVQDGLVLHYDFSHESNTSEYKDKAFDYSGNGNHGVLNNFNYTAESGYENKGLKLDNIDDFVSTNLSERVTDFTILSTVYFSEAGSGMIWGGIPSAFYLRRNLEHALHGSIFIGSKPGIAGKQLSTYANNVFVENEAKKINVGMVVDNESQTYSLIVNGEIIINRDISEELETAPFLLTHVGTWPTLNYANLDGSMHSFQMYNRALTPEEIVHNYAIEKERFNITEGEV